jgi:hypothetical protein
MKGLDLFRLERARIAPACGPPLWETVDHDPSADPTLLLAPAYKRRDPK